MKKLFSLLLVLTMVFGMTLPTEAKTKMYDKAQTTATISFEDTHCLDFIYHVKADKKCDKYTVRAFSSYNTKNGKLGHTEYNATISKKDVEKKLFNGVMGKTGCHKTWYVTVCGRDKKTQKYYHPKCVYKVNRKTLKSNRIKIYQKEIVVIV